jgi:hypothetical protein
VQSPEFKPYYLQINKQIQEYNAELCWPPMLFVSAPFQIYALGNYVPHAKSRQRTQPHSTCMLSIIIFTEVAEGSGCNRACTQPLIPWNLTYVLSGPLQKCEPTSSLEVNAALGKKKKQNPASIQWCPSEITPKSQGDVCLLISEVLSNNGT